MQQRASCCGVGRLAQALGLVLSKRAGEELAFLEDDERGRVVGNLRSLLADEQNEAASVVDGGDWLLSRVGELRIVFRRAVETGRLEVATIRKQEGVSFDPENLGRPPDVKGLTWKSTE